MPAIHLSDDQAAAIDRAAAALLPSDRDRFMTEVARQLAGREIGDGAVHRAVASAFREFWTPPDLSRMSGSSKYD